MRDCSQEAKIKGELIESNLCFRVARKNELSIVCKIFDGISTNSWVRHFVIM